MRFSFFVAALAILPVQAADMSLDGAQTAARAIAQKAVDSFSARTSTIRVDACFERPENAEADRLGLPKSLCLETLSLVIPERGGSPFAYGSYMSAAGKPAAARMHIAGGAREADGWELVGSWLSTSPAEPVCGRLNSAHASVYAKSTLDGTLKDAPVLVRAFLMDGSSLCSNYARAVHFDYRRL